MSVCETTLQRGEVKVCDFGMGVVLGCVWVLML